MRWLQWVRSKRLRARRSANQLLLPWLPRESRYAHALLRATHDVLFRFRHHRALPLLLVRKNARRTRATQVGRKQPSRLRANGSPKWRRSARTMKTMRTTTAHEARGVAHRAIGRGHGCILLEHPSPDSGRLSGSVRIPASDISDRQCHRSRVSLHRDRVLATARDVRSACASTLRARARGLRRPATASGTE